MLQSFSIVWVVLSFKINQTYIARVLCINRNQPELSCNGKCILAQRIQANEGAEKESIPQHVKDQKEILYCLNVFPRQAIYFNGRKHNPQKLFLYQMNLSSAFVRGIFHPPDFS